MPDFVTTVRFWDVEKAHADLKARVLALERADADKERRLIELERRISGLEQQPTNPGE